jgi:asparagine synthase (glutamine-hydrolysing)
MRAAIGAHDAPAVLVADLPEAFPRWTSLAKDQWIEMRTLLAGYILSAQGDRMLMAHSVEGRFPFLDRDVVALANQLPAAYKLAVLDEKHVLKRASRDLVPEEVLRRKKQPYRAPDARSFVGPKAPAWIDDMLSERAVAAAGVFEPAAVRQVLAKCRAAGAEGTFSNTDNMALVAMISTQLLHDSLIGPGRHVAAPSPEDRPGRCITAEAP